MNSYFHRHLDRLTHYQRYKTRIVNIGHVALGGDHPIRIQSMTNTPTMDTAATVAQTLRLVEAGCELVRITAPSVKEAENLAVIKQQLRDRGCEVPLIADIHFVPRAAEVAARIVEKVRVNPGNYADRKRFENLEYDKHEYEAELDRIRERFTPLVKLCREEGTAMRLGANHGSLSDRILSHYGDTPQGMVESAMEFVRICADNDYHELVISMKASNTRVMIQAYRMLVDHMAAEGFNYPLHLGVTEAGDGDDARIKSALGIGSLLKDGFGDTIRVSLTEPPEAEIPVAQKILSGMEKAPEQSPEQLTALPINMYEYQKRQTQETEILGGDHPPVVITDVSNEDQAWDEKLTMAGYRFDIITRSWQAGDAAADILFLGELEIPDTLPDSCRVLVPAAQWQMSGRESKSYPLFDMADYNQAENRHPELNFVQIDPSLDIAALPADKTLVLILDTPVNGMSHSRRIILELMNRNLCHPVILRYGNTHGTRDDLLLDSSSDLGGLFNDGLGDGIWLDTPDLSPADLTDVAFGILQASRSRMTRTEYIACPSCGRTLFDLEEVTAQIRSKTGHLKGLKIGIMGCIVNGPGEMADADFGYVGTGPGKISLYRGQMVVRPHVPQAEAVDALIDLIKEEGYWVDP